MNRRKKNKLIRWIFILLLGWMIALNASSASADMEIHFIDVGQGDAAVILCDGEAMMIDGGPPEASDIVFTYLRKTLNLPHLDYVISTHPHTDHAGGLAAVFNALPVDLFITLNPDSENNYLKNAMKYAQRQGTVISTVAEGDTLKLGEATVKILSAWKDAWTENDMSIVLRIDYKNISAVFTGDAENMAEYRLADSGLNLKADILKIAHHGSRYSSSEEFISSVKPQIAIISCGQDNEYGHPHKEIIDRLEKNSIQILRTDREGTIALKTDGNTIERKIIKKTPSTGGSSYILNVKTMKFHSENCPVIDQMWKKNKKEYSGCAEDLLEMGYTPCGICNPN